MIKKAIIVVCLIVTLQACTKEGTLTPSGKDKTLSERDLPQGNAPHDSRIMEYWNDYHLLTFYKYDMKEFWWTPTKDIRPVWKDGVTKQGYEAEIADEKYVDELVKLLDEHFFAYYTKEFLNFKMPKKMLFVSKLNNVPSSLLSLDNAPRVPLNTLALYDKIIINMANENINSMDKKAINKFKGDVNSTFLSWQYDFKHTVSTEEFHSQTDYTVSHSFASIIATKKMYGAGIINYKTVGLSTASEKDWKDYITAIVSHSYEELTGTFDKSMYRPGTASYNQDLWKASDMALGMLNPSTTDGWDVNGVIRKKYDLITTFFKEQYGINLQAIGNGTATK